MFPKGRIPDDNPVYYFVSFLSMRYVGSGSESSCGAAASGSARSTNFNPGGGCADGVSGTA